LGALLIVAFSLLPVVGSFLVIRPRCGDKFSLLWLFALLPTALMTVLISVQGYYHFWLAKTGQLYGTLPAMGLALILPTALAKIGSWRGRLFGELAVITLFYPLFGGYTLLLGLCLARDEFLLKQTARRTVRALVPLLWGALVPLAWYGVFAEKIVPTSLWTAGMVTFSKNFMDPFSQGLSLGLYAAALVSAVVPPLLVFFRSPPDAKAPDTAPNVPSGAAALLALAVTLTGAVLVFLFSKTDKNYLALLAMARPLENERWDEILAIESACPEPTVPLIELRHLALARTGQIADRLFDRTNVASAAKDIRQVQTSSLFGGEILVRSGSVNQGIWQISERLRVCPESPYLRRLLFEAALANGEYALARKNLILMAPLGRPDWYEAGRQALSAMTRGTEPESGPARRVVTMAETARRLRPTEYLLDHSSAGKAVHLSALHRDFESCCRADQELILSWSLLLADTELFDKYFEAYYKRLRQETPDAPIPAALQQGAIFFEYNITKKFPPTRYPYDKALVARFGEFLKPYKRMAQSGGQDLVVIQELCDRFPDTFWLYQSFISQYPEY
ncbi:MAG: hypothetical protein IIZ25_09360, partial [Thermoguttaceae bacterium]|nr:hypothetical protein [Thermoguttaceae bacterium]